MFWERATATSTPFDLDFFEMVLNLYALDVKDVTVFQASELGFDGGELTELGMLLATMPTDMAERTTWIHKIVNVFRGSRIFMTGLDSIEAVKTVLGV